MCVYVCALASKSSGSPDCTTVSASSAVVDQINELTQIYSGKTLFFLGRVPKLTEPFERGEFLEHTDFTHPLIDELDKLAGDRSRSFFGSLDFNI